jgi:hypothetical protein
LQDRVLNGGAKVQKIDLKKDPEMPPRTMKDVVSISGAYERVLNSPVVDEPAKKVLPLNVIVC